MRKVEWFPPRWNYYKVVSEDACQSHPVSLPWSYLAPSITAEFLPSTTPLARQEPKPSKWQPTTVPGIWQAFIMKLYVQKTYQHSAWGVLCLTCVSINRLISTAVPLQYIQHSLPSYWLFINVLDIFVPLRLKQHFCAIAAKQHFCAIAAKQHFCAIAAKQHFCAIAAKQHFCAIAAKTVSSPCVKHNPDQSVSSPCVKHNPDQSASSPCVKA